MPQTVAAASADEERATEIALKAQQSHAATATVKPLSLLPLITLIFFEVSGGPFGTEDAVGAAGPLLTILGFAILPFVWSVPEALVTAEMATLFPENSGYVAWVTAAFGPFWGFQEGLWSWLSGVTDNSVYPVMFAANLELFFPVLGSGWPRLAFLVSLSLLLSYLNYRGLNVVGHTAISSTLAILVPFVLLTVLSIPVAKPSNWLIMDLDNVNWPTFLNIMFWNLNYWDAVSTLAGEVQNPAKNFPRALMWAIVMVVLFYLVPTLAALSVTTDVGDWTLGYYGKVADMVGGRWLAIWVIVAAGFSQIGQYQAEMASDSYQLQGMAERGFLPKALARKSVHGTPGIGILMSSAGVLCLASFNFVEIVTMLNSIYCMAELLEFAAFVALRIKAPHLYRPYRIPLPTWGVILMLLPASVLLVTILLLPLYLQQWWTVATTVSAALLGCILYPLLQTARKRKWCEFASLHFDCANVYSPPQTPDGEDPAVPPANPELGGTGTEAPQSTSQPQAGVASHFVDFESEGTLDSITAPLLGSYSDLEENTMANGGDGSVRTGHQYDPGADKDHTDPSLLQPAVILEEL